MRSRGFSPDTHYIKYLFTRYSWTALIPLALIGFHTWLGNLIFGVDGSSYSDFGSKVYYHVVDTGSSLSDTIPFAAALSGFLMALVLFSFLWKKRECFSTLSHGISLKNQFLSRYLFGAGIITASNLISFALSYAISVSKLGGDLSGLGIKALLIYLICFTAISLAVYTLFVFCAVLSGRFIEYLITGVGVIALPYAVGQTLRCIFANFLHGSLLGMSRNGLTLGNQDILQNGNIEHFTDRFGAFTSFSSVFDVKAVPLDPNAVEPEILEEYRKMLTIPWLTLLLTLAVTVGLAVLSGYLFIRRPAEKTGQAGICPPLYITAAISVALYISSFVCELYLNRFLLIALFCLLFALLFFILCAVCKASVKGALGHYLPMLVSVGSIWLCLLVCISGAFGYSDYIPETAEIESAVINYIGNPVILRGSRGGAHTIGDGTSMFSYDESMLIDGYVTGLTNYGWWTYFEDMPVLTSENDIEKVIDIHKTVIENGMKTQGDVKTNQPSDADSPFRANWYIVYFLKDGTRVERYYKYVTLGTAEKICSIEESDSYRENYIEKRLGKGANVFTIGETTFEMGDEFFSDIHALDMLTPEENYALFEALTLDFAELSYTDRYFWAGKTLGFIRFASDGGISADGKYVFGNISNLPEDSGRDTWYITEKFTRTLAFLEAHGLMGYFDGNKTVLAVEYQAYNAYTWGVNPTGIGALLFIQSADNVSHSAYVTKDTLQDAVIVQVPESEWDYYLDNSRAVAATTRGGKIVRIIYDNSEGVTKIITRLLPNE